MKKKIFYINLKFFDKRGLSAIPKIFMSSIILLSFFYCMPILINHVDEESFEFQNNSKAVLAYTLDNKVRPSENDNQILNEKELLVDIFSLNEIENDSVRLNASTIKQLFEDTNYTLQDVREKKLVKPVALTLLPTRN